MWGGIHAVAQKSTIPIALRTDCRTQKVKRFRFVALPEFIRTLLLASQRPHLRSTPFNCVSDRIKGTRWTLIMRIPSIVDSDSRPSWTVPGIRRRTPPILLRCPR